VLESRTPIDGLRRVSFVVLLALIFSINSTFVGLAAPAGAEFVDYAQCANGAPPSTSTACPEGWINGILNTNNSHYAEDQVTPQRAEVLVPAGSPSTGRTLTFSYQARKGTIHAYDSLATWNFTQTTANRCEGLSAANCVGGSPSTFPIPADPTVVADTGAGSATALHQLPGQVMTMYGGTITGISVPSHDNAAGAGDDYATVVVTYSVADTASDRLVQLLFGGHLAPSTGPRGWGVGLGAGSVSGGPYHIKWQAADGVSIGNRDNQIMAGAILAPSLAITKTADAASVNAGTSIGFTITVSNTGAGPATNVAVTDALPTGGGISWSESPDNASCSITANALSCSFASIAVGGSVSVHVVSPTTGASCGTYNNTAEFSSAGSTGQATASVTVSCQPDVTVSKSGNGPLTAGDTATFTITVSAGGTGASSNVTLSDTLPSGTWSLGGPDAAQCGIAAGTLSCNFGTMASGTSKTVTLSRATTGADCPSIVNPGATVGATGDTNTANNSTGAVTIVVNCQPDVSITKTGNGPLTAGQTATFTITVTAGGTGPSSNVTVSDTLPAGTWTLSGADAAQCGIAAGTLSCNFGTMASGSSKVVTLSRATDGGDCPSIANTATVSATGDTNTGNNSASATIAVACQPDVSVSKTGNGPITAGGTATFTITVTAGGTGTSTNVTLSDTLPSGTWTLSGADAASCGIAAGALSCTFGSMASGTSKVVTLSRATTGADCPSIANTATVNATGDTNTGNNSSSATIAVTCAPDVSIEKSGSTAISAGGTATFTITVSAGGTGPSSNVTVTDTLPSGTWTLGGTDAAACGITAGVLNCSFGTMAQGTSRTVTLSRVTDSEDCPAITNTAVVNATGDTNTQNNSSTASVTVNCGQITLGKTADSGTVNAGQTIGFIIAVANLGDGTATNVVVTDTLPAGFAWTIDATASDPGCSISADVLTCTYGDLAPSDSRSVHLTSPTTAENCATIRNVASATTDNDGSAEASDSIVINCQPDVSVAKSGNGPLTSGQTATFTITVSAGGTGPSSNVTLTDTLPAGAWTLGGADAASCSLANSSLSCNFGTMASGTSKTITLSRASTAGDCSTPIANTATVNATADSNTQNNSSSASITVNCPPPPQSPQLIVSKTADAAIVTAGAQGTGHVGFTVALTNNGFIPTTAVLADTPLVAAGPSTPAGNAGTLGLTWSIDAFNSDAGCSIAANTLSCNFGTLQPGETRQVHITAPVTGRTSATSRNDNCGQRVDNMATVTIGNGSTRQSNHAIVDIACLPTTSAGSLTIRKYADNNADALQGSGESNLAGWTFEVKNNATGAVRTATTGANGSVTVNDLEAGDYTITEKSCTSPCNLANWKPISYTIGGQATVSNRSGVAQITISAPEQSITFGNQPPLLPSTSTEVDTRDRVQTLVLLLLAALVAQILILRVVAQLSRQKGS
jgi:uncharacterized repeat protein (TIGR01451 family)